MQIESHPVVQPQDFNPDHNKSRRWKTISWNRFSQIMEFRIKWGRILYIISVCILILKTHIIEHYFYKFTSPIKCKLQNNIKNTNYSK